MIVELPVPAPELGDSYVGVSLSLAHGSIMVQGRVFKHSCDNNGNVIGRANKNPIFDNREYAVEFKDGEEAEPAVNTIAQSMCTQCDPDGNQYVMFDSIVNYRRSTTALCCADQKDLKKDNRYFMRRLTAGWQLCVE